jgi:GWxTD domain-containing protein
MRWEIGSLQYVIYPAEVEELLAMTTDYSRRRWINNYWASRDPNYTTAENEMRQEHNRRVAFAQQNFYMPKWPGWDDRGEIHIRYGPPASRRTVNADVDRGGYTQPQEIWYYADYEMLVLFEDAYGRGVFTHFLEKVSGGYNIRMEKIGAGIDEFSGPRMTIEPPTIATDSKTDNYRKMLNRFAELRTATPSTYPSNHERNQVPFVFEIGEFRGGDMVDRVDVNMEFVANFAPRGDRKSRTYRSTAVFWDTERKEVGRRAQNLEVPVVADATDSTRLMPVQLTFALEPGFYYMAVTLEEVGTRRFTSYKKDVTCRDLQSELALSDIIFASKVEATDQPSPFVRGALEVVPHPLRRYRAGAAIPIYFEVYNLNTTNGRSLYTVEYRIVSLTPRAVGFWGRLRGKKRTLDVASSFESSGSDIHDTVNIALGSDNLWPGDWELHVKIIDGAYREVTRESRFTIVE